MSKKKKSTAPWHVTNIVYLWNIKLLGITSLKATVALVASNSDAPFFTVSFSKPSQWGSLQVSTIGLTELHVCDTIPDRHKSLSEFE